MHKIKTLKVSATVLALALLITAGSPAFAEKGDTGGDSSKTEHSAPKTTTEHKSATTEHQSSAAESSKATESESGTDSSTDTSTSSKGNHDDHAELHKKGDDMLADMRKQHKANKTDAQRQKFCQAHKQGLTQKFSSITANSQKIQTRIDGIYSKALAYQVANNLQPANFDTLVATADSAKAASSASITALQAVTPTIDCASTTTASDVATFKAAAQQARDNLKAYRSAVKAVVKALEIPKPTTEGSN